MLKIRLARVGKKKQPTYRFVVSESTKDTQGKAVEILGHYNPFTKVCEIKKDRVLHWIKFGAQMSPTVNNMLIDQNVVTGKKVKASGGKKKKGEEAAPAAEVKKEATPTEAPAEAPAEKQAEPVAETPAPAVEEKKEEEKPAEKTPGPEAKPEQPTEEKPA
ncbi:MAG: 30S ribosomal protein S16 [Candidatus Buchananbacteria bacterium]|nr:30S ribosomal protein S16 [Candidatus Buchananbacteria bacterium]